MRRSNVRTIVLIVTLGLCLAGFAGAGPAPPSNSGAVSGGIFLEPNDQYLSVSDFTDLEADVVFLQFDMPSGAIAGQGFQIGASTELSGMYVAGYLNSVVPGVTGQLGGNNSQITNVDQDFLFDAGGLITGKTEARTVQVDYDVDALNDVRALVGIGPMGVMLRILQSTSNGHGSYTPTGTFPGGANWTAIGVGTGPAIASSFTTFDAAGALVSSVNDIIGVGTDKDQILDFTATVGLPLDLSESLALDVGGGVLVGLRNADESAARETYTRAVGSSVASDYTPAQTADGSDPALISDLVAYNYIDAMESNSYIQITPSVFAKVSTPLNETVTGIGGINIDFGLPLYSANYADSAGTDTKVSGMANSYYSIDLVRAVNLTDPGLTQETTTTTRGWEADDVSGMSLDVDLSAGVTVVPSDRFRFGVVCMPMISYTTQTIRHTGEAIETVVVDNGDGADGIGDSIVETTVTRSGFTETTKSIVLNGQVNTAAQFFLIPARLRVNLGAQVDNMMITKTLAETVTDGIIERTERTATDTTDAATATFVVTDYQVAADVRAATDDSQILNEAGASSVTYDAGLTFFFDENMFLDLRMDAGGGDFWSTAEWSLEMTILH